MAIGHLFETAYLLDKRTGQTTFMGEFYGDPTCGLISSDNRWCLVGGSTLLLWTESNLTEITDNALYGAFKMRQTSPNTVEILIDPWSAHSSIWELDTQTMKKRKISDFDQYKDKQYTEDIDW